MRIEIKKKLKKIIEEGDLNENILVFDFTSVLKTEMITNGDIPKDDYDKYLTIKNQGISEFYEYIEAFLEYKELIDSTKFKTNIVINLRYCIEFGWAIEYIKRNFKDIKFEFNLYLRADEYSDGYKQYDLYIKNDNRERFLIYSVDKDSYEKVNY